MAKPSILIALAISILSLLVCGCSLTSQAQATNHEFSLEPGQRSTLSLDLDKGDVLTIGASVVGDSSVDIGLWLEDSAGTIVVPEKRGHSVELTHGAVSSGRYHVVVNNSYSLLTGKVVSVTTKVEK